MGRDKALIAFQGVPLLRRVAQVALSCTGEVYLITPWPERYQDILPDGCYLIEEVSLPGQGPLVGFAQGLAHMKTDWVLLLACDLPQLRVEVLQTWVTRLPDTKEEYLALLPRQAKGWEPLCGFYRRRCLPTLNEFINRGGRSFQRWLAQQPVQELPVSDTQVLFNCNTPAELDLLKMEN